MRLTRKVFVDLAIWMVAFGLMIGVVFPFFVLLLGVPSHIALTRDFFGACLGAGALAGMINFWLARGVVGGRITMLAERMAKVTDKLRQMALGGDVENCTPEDCSIEVDSEDEIGESARAFNALVETLATSTRTQEAVRSFGQMLSSQLELEAVAQGALEQLMRHTDSAGGAMLVDTGGQIEVEASFGIESPQTLADSDHVKAALRTGQTEVVSVPAGVAIEGGLVDFRPREILFLPIRHKHVPLGVVVLASTDGFGPDLRDRVDLFRHALGLALNNSLAHDRLQRLAALDPLTGVYNRRFGLGRLHEEFSRAVRSNSPLGVFLLDLDHFKAVNDTYGHLVGDRVLTSVAGVVSSILREGDILVRYGGEEFLGLLPAASSEDLATIGERLRRAVEESAVVDGAQTVRITVSVGGAAYPNQNVDSEAALVELADEALYRAKDAGRNRVEIARAGTDSTSSLAAARLTSRAS